MLQHSYCLSLLADYAKPGMSVLDVGSGSGYLTAVFGLMVWRFSPSPYLPSFSSAVCDTLNALGIRSVLVAQHACQFYRLERPDVWLELITFQSLWSGRSRPSSRRLLGGSWIKAELLSMVNLCPSHLQSLSCVFFLSQ